MTWYFPFIFLGSGAVLGILRFTERASKITGHIGNVALIVLMFAIGISVGANDDVISNVGIIGYQSAVISLCALLLSILFVALLEKTLLPLDRLKSKMLKEQNDTGAGIKIDTNKKRSPLVWVIPVCIIAGVAYGYLAVTQESLVIVDKCFIVSLAVLYITVGIGITQNKTILPYIKSLGGKIVLLPVCILLGSLAGGAVSGLLLDMELHISILSAGGMCYYSITGAFMTQAYGIQAGTYGFLVNVFREFFTVLLLPLLIKIGSGAPIAAGASGNMDTMLVPVSKFVGSELGLVAFIIGTILTFTVPVLLPVLAQVF